jgi:hypothetical protein
MRIVFVAFIIVAAITANADDLEDLKAESFRYVASIKAVLALSDDLDCSDTITKANEYAAAFFHGLDALETDTKLRLGDLGSAVHGA